MKSFERWLSETVDFACNKALSSESGTSASSHMALISTPGKVYTHPTTNKRLAGPGAESQPVEIDEGAYMV